MSGASIEQTFSDWLERQDVPENLQSALLHTIRATQHIGVAVRAAPLHGQTGAADNVNVQGEDQKLLDVLANDLMVEELSACVDVAAMVSEEIEDIIQNPDRREDANLIVCFDPVDGSSNIEINGAIGAIFSILAGRPSPGVITTEAVLNATANPLAAGYVFYGPANLLVVTIGKNVAMFAQDPEDGEFRLIDNNLNIARTASEFAINMAHKRFWDKPVTTYIDDCMAGKSGPRKKPFNMRWIGSMVADVHRLFVRGGIFIYPALDKPGSETGKLRLLYEAIPMAVLVEAAGGGALSGTQRLLDVEATSLHQRVPVALGSLEEIDYLQGLVKNH